MACVLGVRCMVAVVVCADCIIIHERRLVLRRLTGDRSAPRHVNVGLLLLWIEAFVQYRDLISWSSVCLSLADQALDVNGFSF